MSNIKVHIKIFSDLEDVSSITSSIKQLELKDLNIDAEFPDSYQVEHNDILILQIKDIESEILNKIMESEQLIENKVVFVLQTEDALLVSSIAKLGFNNIFILPYELYKFITYLEEIITNNLFFTRSLHKVPGEDSDSSFDDLIGESEAFIRVIELAKKVARKSTANILIRGETGAGKGVLAKAIHKYSNGSSSPFVDIVCTAIPEDLLESELFGYEPGAFTNAKNRKLGLFEIAENGTLFLDEIGDLSLNIQSKLLRAIEKKVIRRLGGVRDIPVNARIISATNKDLDSMIEEKSFRSDLFHRLNVVSLMLPPLRERGEDIIRLALYFINGFNKQFGKSVKKIDDDARDFMLNFGWPGNVREFRNALERAVLLNEDSTIRLKDFENLLNIVPKTESGQQTDITLLPQFIRFDLNYSQIGLKELEKLYAKEVLEKTKGNKSKTARILGISRPKLDTLLS